MCLKSDHFALGENMKLFFLLLCVIVLSSCGNKYENMIKNNTAEVRKYLLEAKDDQMNVSLILGLREKNYIVNGYATDLIEFGVLTFEFSDYGDIDKNSASYELLVGTQKFAGILQENPFDQTLVADIKKMIDPTKKVTAKIISGEFSKEIELKYINKDWKVDSDDVYGIVAKNMKSELSQLSNKNSFEGEVYIKIINDADINVSDYYWYVNIIGRGGKRLSLIISPDTKEILAVNNFV